MSPRYDVLAQETRRLRDRADSAERQRRQDVDGDVVVETPRRLLLRSPGGTYYRVTVADDGTLTTTNVGTTL